jgi:hypothetical protein
MPPILMRLLRKRGQYQEWGQSLPNTNIVALWGGAGSTITEDGNSSTVQMAVGYGNTSNISIAENGTGEQVQGSGGTINVANNASVSVTGFWGNAATSDTLNLGSNDQVIHHENLAQIQGHRTQFKNLSLEIDVRLHLSAERKARPCIHFIRDFNNRSTRSIRL